MLLLLRVNHGFCLLSILSFPGSLRLNGFETSCMTCCNGLWLLDFKHAAGIYLSRVRVRSKPYEFMPPLSADNDLHKSIYGSMYGRFT